MKYDILNSVVGKTDFLCQTAPLVCAEKATAFPTTRRTRGFLFEVNMGTKVCRKCGILKLETEFYYKVHQNVYTCKECYKKMVQNNYEKKKDKIIDYKRKYYKQNRKKIMEQHRDKYDRNPTEFKARWKSGDMIKDIRPCEVCGIPTNEKHHDDYLKPLNVRFLCRRDHMRLHAQLKEDK